MKAELWRVPAHFNPAHFNPARDDEGVFAIVTTDLPVDPPGKE